MKFAIYGQTSKPIVQNIILRLLKVFQDYEHEIIFEEQFYNLLKHNNILSKEYDVFGKNAELSTDVNFFISIGGDGTMLRAANFIKDKNIPVVGINAGRLGFLANVQQDDIEELLPNVFTNNFKLSKRSLVSFRCNPPKNNDFEIQYALNEITVSRKNTTSMITVDTYLDDEFLASYWADGLIIATPSGSTGYSLSCGGPIIEPETNCFVITPLAPHNLNVRPLVIRDNLEIKLKVSSREKKFLLSLDTTTKTVTNETEVIISKAPFTMDLVEFPSQSFIKTLRNKLLWGEDKRN
ncbi:MULTISPECIES: NAD kinase [Myroides]|uniref:NAD kinase n=1 Tax=Myroides albus TaxID=2562892 RepID=A0A6I3LF29_9FLAO|nr:MULTISPECIES: NAD kinase [Myroides]MTG96813.1 NAD kinase [Myroides albus]MVX36918.1 NAD kinase [Myroides sp. LoEW2-1]UVD78437.1 NAD kinase [Myroides albus]